METVGIWAERKYRLIGYYARLFATSMKNTWQCRVYIDLFSSSGLSKIKGSGRIVPASPFYVLDLPDPFDFYIFCDIDSEKIETLHGRVQEYFPDANAFFHLGDSNSSISEIVRKIPMHSRGYKVLSFCLLDLYRLADLKFDTIKDLSDKFVDFLILVPTGMELQRFWDKLTEDNNSTLDYFLGDVSWRERWEEKSWPEGDDFTKFIMNEFGARMTELGFIDLGFEEAEPIFLRGKQVLYHMAFYSRNKKGVDFWRRARKGTVDQLSLPLRD